MLYTKKSIIKRNVNVYLTKQSDGDGDDEADCKSNPSLCNINKALKEDVGNYKLHPFHSNIEDNEVLRIIAHHC